MTGSKVSCHGAATNGQNAIASLCSPHQDSRLKGINTGGAAILAVCCGSNPHRIPGVRGTLRAGAC